jgi:two-component system NarL family response regulator
VADTVRVIVVDDEEDVRLLLDVALGLHARIDVVGLFGGAERAIAVAPSLSPDVIVLDLSMPGTSGLDALPRLRAAVPAARIVVYSASDHPDVARAALDAGASMFLLKATTSITNVVDAVAACA